MEATDILMEEHEVVLRVIAALEVKTHLLETGTPVRPGFFIDAAEFIKGFADGCHHKKEEGVLFQAMSKNGIAVEGGPIGVMLMDHEAGRTYTRRMRAAAEKLENGDEAARKDVVENARGYALLLRQHIAKENNILFPMAGRVIPRNQQADVSWDFEHIEHEETGEGIHEKYLALAVKLEREAGTV